MPLDQPIAPTYGGFTSSILTAALTATLSSFVTSARRRIFAAYDDDQDTTDQQIEAAQRAIEERRAAGLRIPTLNTNHLRDAKTLSDSAVTLGNQADGIMASIMQIQPVPAPTDAVVAERVAAATALIPQARQRLESSRREAVAAATGLPALAGATSPTTPIGDTPPAPAAAPGLWAQFKTPIAIGGGVLFAGLVVAGSLALGKRR